MFCPVFFNSVHAPGDGSPHTLYLSLLKGKQIHLESDYIAHVKGSRPFETWTKRTTAIYLNEQQQPELLSSVQ
jgi:hypothetical protein